MSSNMADFADGDIVYRPGRHEDIQHAFEMCYADGWAVSYQLIEGFYLSCPQSFIAVEHNKKAIGYCMGDIISDEEAFVCVFIVDDAYQRRGIGGKLFKSCMEVLGDRNVTLYATEKGARYYKKHFGFKTAPEKPRIVLLGIFQPDKTAFKDFSTSCVNPAVKLVPLKDIPLEQLEEYDTKIHIVNRRKSLEDFRSLENAVAAVSTDNRVVGYGCLRHMAEKTYKLGPVFGDSAQLGNVITKQLLEKLPEGCRLMMLCLEENPDAVNILTKLGATKIGRMEVLYTKYQMNVPIEKIFCVDNAGNCFA